VQADETYPLTTIEPHVSARFDLHELWTSRELLYFLVWRDIKVRYKQTLVGVGWAILQPLLAMVVLTAVFGSAARLPSGGVP
jgi:lipopolysaccharide transport system permease protein